MNEITTTADEFQTIAKGEELAEKLKPGDIVFLRGNLGAGKTTFTKGLAKGMGTTTRIISPTFILVRSYKCSNSQGIQTLYHLDLYRLKDENQVKNINIEDYLSDDQGVVVIEWPDISQNLVKRKTWVVNLEVGESDSRKIRVCYE